MADAVESVGEAKQEAPNPTVQQTNQTQTANTRNVTIALNAEQLLRGSGMKVPFIMLFLIVFVSHHLFGISFFIIISSLIFRQDAILKAQVALKEDHKRWIILSVFFSSTSTIITTYLIFSEEKLWRLLVLHYPPVIDFMDILWIVSINDLMVRCATLGVKSLLTLRWSFYPTSSIKLKHSFSAADSISRLYRVLITTPLWTEYYANQELGSFLSSTLPGFYLVYKSLMIFQVAKDCVNATNRISRGELPFGRHSTPEEVAELGNPSCSICFDNMTNPVTLGCSHIFCESCISEWLDRESTCPLCRVTVAGSEQFRSANSVLVAEVF